MFKNYTYYDDMNVYSNDLKFNSIIFRNLILFTSILNNKCLRIFFFSNKNI